MDDEISPPVWWRFEEFFELKEEEEDELDLEEENEEFWSELKEELKFDEFEFVSFASLKNGSRHYQKIKI